MFRHVIDQDLDLRLIEIAHASELFRCIDGNRNYLRPWLTWVDETKCEDDTRDFIKDALQQFATNEGFHAGIFVDAARRFRSV